MEKPRRLVVVTGAGEAGPRRRRRPPRLRNPSGIPGRGAAHPCLVEEAQPATVLQGFLDVAGREGYSTPDLERRAIGATQLLFPLQLVVHVGLSGMATTVTLEKCGHNIGYRGLDNCRFCPGSQCCIEGGPECIDSVIDMDAVCKRVSTLGLDVAVTISKDAGRYLCDFTYYTSLYHSHGRSAFVHVPPLGRPYSADQLGRALQAIIAAMLSDLKHSDSNINCHNEH
ncbi:pyroglutamyl-peptidase 1 isoform X4 [Podarcis muralis]